MRITFERSGGFAGIRLTTEVDTGSLPAAEVQELRDLIEAAGFFGLPAVIRATVPGADRFQYVISIERKRNGERHTVRTTDGAAPESLQPLLDHLTHMAKKGRRVDPG